MSVSAVYEVKGMTCDHCVRAVTSELLLVPGVQSVDVDLGSGQVTVVSEGELLRDDVADAIDEAGYELG